MAEHIWTVLCGRQLIDPDDKVISLIDVLESVAIEGLSQKIEEASALGKRGALVNVPMLLVSWWFRSDANEDTLRVRFALTDPAGTSLFTQPAEMKWAENANFTRLFVRVDKLPATALGLYWFVVEQPSLSETGETQWIPTARVPFSMDTA